MTIGIDATQAVRFQRTGVEWYSYHLIRELKAVASEHQVRLYARNREASELNPLPSAWEWRQCRWPFPVGWTAARLAFELAMHPPDVFFTPGYRIPSLCRSPAVVTIHDVAFRDFPQAYRHPRLLDLMHRINVSLAHAIICPSQATAEAVQKHYAVRKEAIAVIAHGIDPFLYRRINDELLDHIMRRYALELPFVLYVGRLEEKKNVIAALAIVMALRKLDSISYKFVLVGRRGDGYERIEEWIRLHDAQGWVIELGWIPPQEVACLLNRACAYLTVSRAEGFALTILEALACGTSTIASDIPVHREVGGDFVRYVDPQDAMLAAQAVSEEIADDNQARRAARAAYASQFSWRKTAEETIRVLLRVGSGEWP